MDMILPTYAQGFQFLGYGGGGSTAPLQEVQPTKQGGPATTTTTRPNLPTPIVLHE